MKIYVARHGQTQLNVEDRVCGSTDIPLTEVGLKQADKLAANTASIKIDVIIASDMIRARQTARAVAKYKGLPVITDSRLREQDFGRWEGHPRGAADYQAEKRRYFSNHNGGESVLRLAQRVYNALDDIISNPDYQDKNILIVCHGGVRRTVRSYFQDMENEEYSAYSPDNASLVEYSV